MRRNYLNGVEIGLGFQKVLLLLVLIDMRQTSSFILVKVQVAFCTLQSNSFTLIEVMATFYIHQKSSMALI